MYKILILFLFIIFLSCKKKKPAEIKELNNGWKYETVNKTVENLFFTFPSEGFVFEQKDNYVELCAKAIKPNLSLMGLKEYKDSIQIKFYRSKEEMRIKTSYGSSGYANHFNKTVYLTANESSAPPIKHELMHLLSMRTWGVPSRSSDWMNEGLGTFAENNCDGKSVGEIYRYLMEKNKLISMNQLSSDFYKQPEMIGYHQAGYIVEHLLDFYTIEQFKRLWKDGFENFERIYGVSFSKVKADLEKIVAVKYPNAPEIDFEKFSKGCK